jgi:hypothetical protein
MNANGAIHGDSRLIVILRKLPAHGRGVHWRNGYSAKNDQLMETDSDRQDENARKSSKQ